MPLLYMQLPLRNVSTYVNYVPFYKLLQKIYKHEEYGYMHMVHMYRGCTFVMHTVTNSMLCSLDTVYSWLHILCIIGGRKVGAMGL